jgi:hypothetical protein
MSTQGSPSGAPAIGPPEAAAVPHNDWTLLEVPPVGELEPSATASVLIEGPDPHGAAALTAAALAAQSYPASLVEVIAPGDRREPEGDLLLLVGAGTIPAPDHLAAHARWHHGVADAVSLGPAAPIDGAGLEPDALRRGGDEAALAATLEPRRIGEDRFELLLDLTAELTDLQGGLFLGAALGTLAVRRETYLAVGGAASDSLPAPLRRLDLAYRLACHGTLFAPERSVPAWTVSGGDEADLAGAIVAAATAERTVELDYPGAASLVPLAPFRPTASPRRFRRPAVTIDVDVGGEPASEVLATIDPVLGGLLGDFELRIQVDDAHPEREAIAAAVHDPRVSIGPPSTDSFCESPFQVVLPAVALPDPRTVADLHSLLVAEGVGALHVTVPGTPPDETMIEALATGSLARARRVAAATGEGVEVALGRLFGERWVSGVEVSVRRHGVSEPHVTEHGPLAAATDADHERVQHLRFRDRADDLDAKTAAQARRILAERLRAREERLRAAQLDARLRELG